VPSQELLNFFRSYRNLLRVFKPKWIEEKFLNEEINDFIE
jgi:hypothetical protein